MSWTLLIIYTPHWVQSLLSTPGILRVIIQWHFLDLLTHKENPPKPPGVPDSSLSPLCFARVSCILCDWNRWIRVGPFHGSGILRVQTSYSSTNLNSELSIMID